VHREKAIYHTLNKMNMDHSKKILVAEAWLPAAACARVGEVLRLSAETSQNQVCLCVCVRVCVCACVCVCVCE
jgi:V-type H+-transporting ATPase subunit a